jgi:hypothetical protein
VDNESENTLGPLLKCIKKVPFSFLFLLFAYLLNSYPLFVTEIIIRGVVFLNSDTCIQPLASASHNTPTHTVHCLCVEC